jgi:hypothetical protein
MRIWLAALFFLAPVWAGEALTPLAEAEPPKCEKVNRSQFWPHEANESPRTAMRLAREGKLLICTRDVWRYKWRPVTYNIQAATAKAEAATAGKNKP